MSYLVSADFFYIWTVFQSFLSKSIILHDFLTTISFLLALKWVFLFCYIFIFFILLKGIWFLEVYNFLKFKTFCKKISTGNAYTIL